MSQEKTLLASDMDGTVIPLDDDAAREGELAELREALQEAENLVLAYVTGRGFALARKGIRDHGLPEPELLVCNVGTSVYHAGPDGFEPDEDYARRMEEALGGRGLNEIRKGLEDTPHLRLQPEEQQSEFKLSYELDPGIDHADIRAEVGRRLEALGGRVQTVYSVRARDGLGLLDLLPAGVAKDFAIHYLREHTEVHPDRLVYAGDSGNDLAAMLTGFKVIVVGNAPEELKEELSRKGRERDILSRLYFARHPFARGVLEGCRHFGVL